jgi:hypothetical protein
MKICTAIATNCTQKEDAARKVEREMTKRHVGVGDEPSSSAKPSTPWLQG